VYYVGIDISKNTFDYFIRTDDVDRIDSGKLKQNKEGYSFLLSSLKDIDPKDILIGFESTSTYHINLFNFLVSNGLFPSIINSYAVHNFAKHFNLRGAKTDKIDAKIIARFLLTFSPTPSKGNLDEIKLISREMVKVTKHITKLKNELKRLINLVFPELDSTNSDVRFDSRYKGWWIILKHYPSAKKISKASVEDLYNILPNRSKRSFTVEKLEKLILMAKDSVGSNKPSLEKLLVMYVNRLITSMGEKEELEQVVLDLMDEDNLTNIELLKTIPGIDSLSISIVSEIIDISRFHSAKSLVAFAGIDPVPKQSGDKDGYRRISKRGSKYLRRAIGMAANSARMNNDYFKYFYNKLVNSGKPHWVALMALANKLLRIIYSLLKNKTEYDPLYHYKLMS